MASIASWPQCHAIRSNAAGARPPWSGTALVTSGTCFHGRFSKNHEKEHGSKTWFWLIHPVCRDAPDYGPAQEVVTQLPDLGEK